MTHVYTQTSCDFAATALLALMQPKLAQPTNSPPRKIKVMNERTNKSIGDANKCGLMWKTREMEMTLASGDQVAKPWIVEDGRTARKSQARCIYLMLHSLKSKGVVELITTPSFDARVSDRNESFWGITGIAIKNTEAFMSEFMSVTSIQGKPMHDKCVPIIWSRLGFEFDDRKAPTSLTYVTQLRKHTLGVFEENKKSSKRSRDAVDALLVFAANKRAMVDVEAFIQ